MGIEKLKEVAGALAGVLNIASRFVNKEGVWVLIGLKDVVGPLVSMDWQAVILEIKDLQESEREELAAHFNEKLVLVKKNVEGKIEQVVMTLEEAIDIVEDAVASGKKAYQDGLALIEKVKTLFAAPVVHAVGK